MMLMHNKHNYIFVIKNFKNFWIDYWSEFGDFDVEIKNNQLIINFSFSNPTTKRYALSWKTYIDNFAEYSKQYNLDVDIFEEHKRVFTNETFTKQLEVLNKNNKICEIRKGVLKWKM